MQKKRIDPRSYWLRFKTAMRTAERAAFEAAREEAVAQLRMEERAAVSFLGLAQLPAQDEVFPANRVSESP